MSVVIPYTFVALTKARAAEVNANFQAISAKFTEGAGGISDGDISTTAGIRGSKLSSVAGNRITQAQLDDDAVDLRVLKDDAGVGAPNAAVNTAAHIKDAIITNAKLVAGTVAKDRLKVTEVTQAFSFGVLAAFGGQFPNAIEITPSPALPLLSAMLPIRCTVESYGVAGPGAAGAGAIVSVDNKGAATLYIMLYHFTGSSGTMTITGTIRFTYLALT